jgi:hypothetical protein
MMTNSNGSVDCAASGRHRPERPSSSRRAHRADEGARLGSAHRTPPATTAEDPVVVNHSARCSTAAESDPRSLFPNPRRLGSSRKRLWARRSVQRWSRGENIALSIVHRMARQAPPMCTRSMHRAEGREQLRAWSFHHSRRPRSNNEPAHDDSLPSAEPATERDPRQRVDEAVLIAIILLAIVILVLT